MFRILSLDGGGIRGAYAAACLARLEQEIGRPISDYFDLIAGTSTGGIIALALALGERAERIRTLYSKSGPRIFTPREPAALGLLERVCLSAVKRKFRPFDDRMLHRSKYSSEMLRDVLTEVFGDRTLEAATSSRLVIPAVDLIYGRTITFKTPHQPNFIRDRHLKAVDVALATGAAPAYFPPASIKDGSAFADGGLWANNPALVAWVEAMKIRDVCKRPDIDPTFTSDNIFMVSIGTGEPTYYAKPDPQEDGLLWWGPRLFDVAGGAQSQGAHFQALYLMGEQRYIRIDFKMPSDPWPLDEVAVLPQLIHYGEQAAVDFYPRIRERFFFKPKKPYHPFPEH
jgi:hypothetical protein